MAWLSSFSVLESSALVALTSILVPILIHLINRTRGKLVFIGHIELVKNIPKTRITEIKLSQYLLLALRLMILTISVLVLAQLVIRDEILSSDKKKQIYLSKDWVYSVNEKQIRAVFEQGQEHEFFLLEPEFPTVTYNELIERRNLNTNQSFNKPEDLIKLQPHYSVDALLLSLGKNRQLSENALIYATNRLSNFSDRLVNFRHPYQWKIKDTKNEIDLADSTSNLVDVLLIYDETRVVDQAYIQLALNVLDDMTGDYQTEVMSIDDFRSEFPDSLNRNSENRSAPDWVIWLSEQKIPGAIIDLLKHGTYVLSDSEELPKIRKKGKVYIGDSLIEISATVAPKDMAGNNEEKSQERSSPSWFPVWRMQTGQPFLISREFGNGKQYQLLSRFNPEWNNWVEQTTFPQQLIKIFKQKEVEKDKAFVGMEQLSIRNQSPSQESSSNIRTLVSWLTILLALLWLLERWLAERRPINYE